MFSRKCAPVTGPVEPDYWELTVTTPTDSLVWNIVISGTDLDVDIDWGDASSNNYTSAGTVNHTYATAGTYTVKISGGGTNVTFKLGTGATDRPYLKSTGVIAGVSGFAVDAFNQTFYGCTGLTSLPTDLFRAATQASTQGFYQTFYGCTGLTSLPTDLFRYNTGVTTNGFHSIFRGCTGLTSLPADLFRYNTSVETASFRDAFYSCTNLASLPADLFRYNTSVGDLGFRGTFYGCTKLQLRSDIFFASGEEGTRFKDRISSFRDCFYLTGAFSGTKGTAPALWACDFGSVTPTKTNCFEAHSADSVDNFASIPTEWI